MPRKGQSEEKILLRQVESGKKVADVCREMGVSQQTFYTWKKRYAGVGVSERRELRRLREENLRERYAPTRRRCCLLPATRRRKFRRRADR